jgi:hypothetical protein
MAGRKISLITLASRFVTFPHIEALASRVLVAIENVKPGESLNVGSD